jgi:branched-chain amino acid transport system ATP-binding protein
MRILEAKRLSMRFGGLLAVDQLDLQIDEGQIFGLIGPNGAGKTTAFNCIAGVYQATSGEIFLHGESTSGQRPWDLCRKGLARTFQVVKPFATKTVLYNVAVGGFARTSVRARAEEKALEVLESLHLAEKKDALAGNLTIGERKRLEIARALATEPRLLLLDEVMAGLRPTEVDEMVRILKRLRDGGITIFLIEHIMRAVMTLSDRIVVIQYGKKIAEGTPREIASDENVIKAYLGEEYGAA